METTVTDQRAEYIKGLRALADVIEQHPDLRLPSTGHSDWAPIHVIPRDDQRAELAAWARVLPGRKAKSPRGEYLDLEGTLHGLHIKVICDRGEVCERVVVGTEEVTKEVPDPEYVAAAPMVTVTETVEQVEWRCGSILADAADGPLADEMAIAS